MKRSFFRALLFCCATPILFSMDPDPKGIVHKAFSTDSMGSRQNASSPSQWINPAEVAEELRSVADQFMRHILRLPRSQRVDTTAEEARLVEIGSRTPPMANTSEEQETLITWLKSRDAELTEVRAALNAKLKQLSTIPYLPTSEKITELQELLTRWAEETIEGVHHDAYQRGEVAALYLGRQLFSDFSKIHKAAFAAQTEELEAFGASRSGALSQMGINQHNPIATHAFLNEQMPEWMLQALMHDMQPVDAQKLLNMGMFSAIARTLIGWKSAVVRYADQPGLSRPTAIEYLTNLARDMKLPEVNDALSYLLYLDGKTGLQILEELGSKDFKYAFFGLGQLAFELADDSSPEMQARQREIIVSLRKCFSWRAEETPDYLTTLLKLANHYQSSTLYEMYAMAVCGDTTSRFKDISLQERIEAVETTSGLTTNPGALRGLVKVMEQNIGGLSPIFTTRAMLRYAQHSSYAEDVLAQQIAPQITSIDDPQLPSKMNDLLVLALNGSREAQDWFKNPENMILESIMRARIEERAVTAGDATLSDAERAQRLSINPWENFKMVYPHLFSAFFGAINAMHYDGDPENSELRHKHQMAFVEKVNGLNQSV